MPEIRCPRTVGRDAELAALRAAVTSAQAGIGGLVFVTGPAGIGKSRLLGDALDAADAAGLVIAVGRATPTERTVAFRPLNQALSQLLRERGRPDVTGDLAPWLAPLAAIAPLGEAADTSLEHSVAERGEAVLQLLRHIPGRPGAVVALEDVHWADLDTLAVLGYVSDAVRSEPVLWLVTARADRGSPAVDLVRQVRTRRGVTTMGLSRLDPGAVAEMVLACRPEAGGELVRRVQRSSDGLPLFVEEIVAAHGVPASFAQAVEETLAGLGPTDRQVFEAAAVVGDPAAWDVLPALTGLSAEQVAQTFDAPAASSLLLRDGGGPRFRHTLTRDAVLATVGVARRREISRAALDELDRCERTPLARDLAADLAEQAGDRQRAGTLAADAGKQAVRDGALATACETLRRAVALLGAEPASVDARLALVRALSLAGRIDEALAEGATLVALLTAEPTADRDRRLARARLALAEAAVQAARWDAAARFLAEVLAEVGAADAEITPTAALLAAEVEFATDRVEEARRRVSELLAADGADADLRCRAYGLLGRIERLHDLGAARESFENALAVARAGARPVRVLDALHELGTIEMFDHAGTARLREARALAEQLGAMGTAAVLDLQLAATHLGLFDTAAAERHARTSYELGVRLGLRAVATKALCELAETHAQRLDESGMERLLARATASDPADPFIPAFAWGQCRGLLAVFTADWPAALRHLERGMELLDAVPHPEPLEFRAMWPLLLARAGDPRAAAALAHARSGNLSIAFGNRGLLGYAAAILTGRAGDRARATELALGADAYLVRYPFWGDLARACAAEPAEAAGWGRPERWLADAADGFAALGLDPLARRCRRAATWRPNDAGLTSREHQVLELIAQGLPNKEIGELLHVSPRTVEKHVESLLRKTGSRSRTQLAVRVNQGETT